MEKHTVVGKPEDLLKEKYIEMFSDFEQVRVIIIGLHNTKEPRRKLKVKKVLFPNKKKVRENE